MTLISLFLIQSLARVHNDQEITHKVFMELSAERIPIGRIIIGLYGKVAPKTVENFYRICSNEHGLTPEGIPLSYEGTYFTTINDRMLIGGDFTHFNGLGGASIYGKPFKSENFDLKHFGPMLVSSYATEDDLNLSQFVISLQDNRRFDNYYTCFGEVIEGQEVIWKAAEHGSKFGKPKLRVTIVKTGVVLDN